MKDNQDKVAIKYIMDELQETIGRESNRVNINDRDDMKQEMSLRLIERLKSFHIEKEEQRNEKDPLKKKGLIGLVKELKEQQEK